MLNVSHSATRALELGNETVTFETRFGGVPRQLQIPVDAVLGIYARETGQGMIFGDDDSAPGGPGAPSPSPPSVPPERRDHARQGAQSSEAHRHQIARASPRVVTSRGTLRRRPARIERCVRARERSLRRSLARAAGVSRGTPRRHPWGSAAHIPVRRRPRETPAARARPRTAVTSRAALPAGAPRRSMCERVRCVAQKAPRRGRVRSFPRPSPHRDVRRRAPGMVFRRVSGTTSRGRASAPLRENDVLQAAAAGALIKSARSVARGGGDQRGSRSSASIRSQRQWITSRCTSWILHVRSAGTRISMSPGASAPAIAPPSRPVSATTRSPRSCAA